MNIEEIKTKYNKLINKAVKIMLEIDEPVHGIGHVRGVVDNTIRLLAKEPSADKEVCIVAAYWHDVGRKYGKQGHELKSAEMLKDELTNLNYSNEFIEKCYKAIYKHGEKDMPDTIEGIVVRDADKLDNLGIERWKECVERNIRPPRVIKNLKDRLLLMDCSKEIYDEKANEWLDYLKSVTIGDSKK